MNRAPGHYRGPMIAATLIKLLARRRMTVLELTHAAEIERTTAQKWMTAWHDQGLVNSQRRETTVSSGPPPEEFWLASSWKARLDLL